MTTTSAAAAQRESARRGNGEFGEHTHSAPEVSLAPPRQRHFSVITHAAVTRREPVPYPDDIPAGGAVTAGLESVSGTVYVTVTFPDGRAVMAGTDNFRRWDSVTNDDGDSSWEEAEGQRVVEYAGAVLQRVSWDFQAVSNKVIASVGSNLVAAATGTDRDEPLLPAVETASARMSELLAAINTGEDPETTVQDTLTDFIHYARVNSLDFDSILERAQNMAQDEFENPEV